MEIRYVLTLFVIIICVGYSIINDNIKQPEIPIKVVYSNLSTDSVESYIYENQSEKKEEVVINTLDQDRWEKDILSYNISNTCNSGKKEKIRDNFDLIKNKTNISLKFWETSSNADISFYCSEQMSYIDINGLKDGYTTAGISTSRIIGNSITSGNIELLQQYSNQDRMLILHEILHSLGLDHSGDTESVMYPVQYDKQTFDKTTIEQLERLYPI